MAETRGPEILEAPSSVLEAEDRRRPGRSAAFSPSLIQLLRKPLPEGEDAAALRAEETLSETIVRDEIEDGTDDLAPARGVLTGLLLSAPLWAILVVILNVVF